MPRFIVLFQGQESFAELKPGANSVGRQSSCAIPLKDSTLSRLHCEVILAGTVATLLDKGSKNGTLLNGKKIDAQVLQPGDKIVIGATTLWYEKKGAEGLHSPAPSTRQSVPRRSRSRPTRASAGQQASTATGRSRSRRRRPRPRPPPCSPPGRPPTALNDYAFRPAGRERGRDVPSSSSSSSSAWGYAGKKHSPPDRGGRRLDNLLARNAHSASPPAAG
jgi:hypothetical protein